MIIDDGDAVCRPSTVDVYVVLSVVYGCHSNFFFLAPWFDCDGEEEKKTEFPFFQNPKTRFHTTTTTAAAETDTLASRH